MCTEKRRGAACCAPTSPYPDSRVLRPAARPSAAVAVAPAPAPAPPPPALRCRPPPAVAATGPTPSRPSTTAAANRRVRAEPVPEGHLDAGARAHPVDEQVARAVGESVAAAVVVRPIPVPVKAVPEAEAVGPVEDRIVAQERIIKERIVAGAVEGPVAIAVRTDVAEAHGRRMW